MIPVPTGRLFLYFTLPFIIMLFGYDKEPLLYIALTADIFLIFLCLYDYLSKTKSIKFDYRLIFPEIFSIGRKNKIRFTYINQSKKRVRLELKLDLPNYWENHSLNGQKTVSPGSSVDFDFELRSVKRDRYTFQALYIVVYSKLELLKIPIKLDISKTVDVYPDIKELNRYIKMMRLNRSVFEGNHINRFHGSGTELNYLREYHMEDDFRSIDWKATTRAGKTISKVFRNESAGSVTFIIDCGRMMLSEENGLTALDHSINSILLLSHIIIKAGDSVSILAFSDRIIGELPPVRGKGAIRKILKFVTALQPESIESNYTHMFEYLRTKIKKRSMIILVSDIMDDINYTVLESGLSYFNRRHLSVLVLLKDVVLNENADRHAKTAEDLYTSSAAKEMVLQRDMSVKKLKRKGIGVLDLLPENLTPGMINKYFEVKSSNLL